MTYSPAAANCKSGRRLRSVCLAALAACEALISVHHCSYATPSQSSVACESIMLRKHRAGTEGAGASESGWRARKQGRN